METSARSGTTEHLRDCRYSLEPQWAAMSGFQSCHGLRGAGLFRYQRIIDGSAGGRITELASRARHLPAEKGGAMSTDDSW